MGKNGEGSHRFLWFQGANKAVVQAVKTHDFWVWVVLVYFFASQQFFTDVFLFCGHVFLVKVVSLKIFMEKHTQDKDNLFFSLGGRTICSKVIFLAKIDNDG